MKKLFTERHGEAEPRVSETLDEAARNGLLTLISARIDEEWFGLSLVLKENWHSLSIQALRK